MDTMLLIIWIAVAVLAVIIEGLTVSVVSCWFAVGSVFSIFAYLFGASPLIQFIVFVTVSILTLIIARPFLKKHTKAIRQPTNADMYIGSEAVVTESIENLQGKGQIKAKGLEWTARSENGEIIAEGETVIIKRIEGVKAIVSTK